MSRATDDSKAIILRTVAVGRIGIDTLAHALGNHLRAAAQDLMAEGLVMAHPDQTLSLTPKGQRFVDNMGSVKAD